MKLANLSKSAKIGISWAAITLGGVYAFYLSKNSVISQRKEHMKVRERMRKSNTGEYEPSTRKYANEP